MNRKPGYGKRNNKQVHKGSSTGDDKPGSIYAAAATTGAAGGASTGLASSTTAAGSAGVSAAASAVGASVAGCSRGATGAGSSILGGFSSTLAGAGTSALGFVLKNSPTRDESRRPSLIFFSSAFFSSSFYSPSRRSINYSNIGNEPTYNLLLSSLSSRGLPGRSFSSCLGLLHWFSSGGLLSLGGFFGSRSRGGRSLLSFGGLSSSGFRLK